MTGKPHSRNVPRLLVVLGVITIIATGTAMALRPATTSESPPAIQPYVAEPTQPSPPGEGAWIDHTVVNRSDPQVSPDSTGMSVAAYGL
jgi:hypothetical protein